MPAFDTLQLAQDLEEVFPSAQAQALARVMSRHVSEDLVTRRDVGDLEAKIEHRLQGLETSLRQDIKDKAAEIKIDLIKWMVGALIVNLLGNAGLMITLIKNVTR